MKPQFFGIGAQKCATVWLYNILSSHPQISLPMSDDGDKDTKFFSYFYDRGFEWYERYYSNLKNEVMGELSTSYFCNPSAPERINGYAKDVKLIVNLRNPVERAYSNHKHEIRLGRVSGNNLEFKNGLKNNPMYLYQSYYYTHLSKWFQYFPKDQFYIIIVEELKNNADQIVENLYAFLGVDPLFKPFMLEKRIHTSSIPKNLQLEGSLRKASTFLRNYGFGNLIDFLKSKGLQHMTDKMLYAPDETVFPPLKDETREKLMRHFEEENQKLENLINKDLSCWR